MAKVPPKQARRNTAAAVSTPRPFLRWVGGKFHLTSVLLQFTPEDVLDRVYHEPFLGAASLFFALRHPNAHLSDLNGHLIDCYRVIRDHPVEVAKAIGNHENADSEKYYYVVRDLYNRSRKGVARAARFVYLNRTGFNGVFRVNMEGQYNVPYGRKENPYFPSRAELVGVAAALKRATLYERDYSTALAAPKAGHFVYLDPPYPPLNGTSFFTHYTSDRFGEDHQARVATCVRSLNERGCLIMVSNADTPAIRKLYKGFHLQSISVRRSVSSSKKKHRVKELIITNYSTRRA